MSYRKQLYKSNTVVQGGSNMSEQDLSRKLEVGDLIVGECRCDPSKKGIVEVVQFPVFEENNYSLLRFPSGVELWTFGDGTRDYGRTVGGVISFITEERYEDRHHCNRDYHNWKHIPKRDFTWEVGDILYGECACTPSKFVVFEYCGGSDYKVVDCWDKNHIGRKQYCSYDPTHHGYNTLNEYVKGVFFTDFVDYNYTKYTASEWRAKQIKEKKRSTSKLSRLTRAECALEKKWTPQDWTRRGFADGPYIFKKSEYKMTETDKEIQVAPRPKKASGVVSIQRDGTCFPRDYSFVVNEVDIETFFSDIKILIDKYKDEQ